MRHCIHPRVLSMSSPIGVLEVVEHLSVRDWVPACHTGGEGARPTNHI